VRVTLGPMSSGAVVAVSRHEAYAFSKPVREEISLIAGVGVAGDAHAGTTVKHRSRVRADPSQPNLRQVHLLAAELFEEVREQGYEVTPGQLGENVTTRGVDLLRLPRGTILRFGPAAAGAGPGADSAALAGILAVAGKATMSAATAAALAAVTAAAARDAHDRPDQRPAVIVAGLRNPCAQIDGFRPGLRRCVLGRDGAGNPVPRAGVMGVVLRGGPIRPGDPITADLPPPPHLPLERV
jgi:MOSC domain-containing protein YiiM